MCFCSAKFLWFSYLCKLIYSIQLPSASLQLAVCCRWIPGNKDSICKADAVFIKLYLARYRSNSTLTNQFCLEIICCRVHLSFNYLIYPYYPAHMDWCYHFVIGTDNISSAIVDNKLFTNCQYFFLFNTDSTLFRT